MFVGTVVTAIGLVRERENGTLEQLAVMPIKPTSVVVGKITPYFVLASVDMIIVTVQRRPVPAVDIDGYLDDAHHSIGTVRRPVLDDDNLLKAPGSVAIRPLATALEFSRFAGSRYRDDLCCLR